MTQDAALIPFHTFLWKIASRCNLNCTYCYVYNSVDDGWRAQPKLMSRAVAERAAARMVEHLQAHQKQSVSIVFHGGEPLMGGLRHLAMLTSVIREAFRGKGISVNLGLQTNLLLLTREIADFLVENQISVGVSLDGPPRINDRNRVDLRGKPTSARLEEKLDLLLAPKYRPIFGGFLCVIDPATDPVEVTDYLLDYDPIGIDFLFPLDNHDRLPIAKAGKPEATPYGDWLVRSFDHWMGRPNVTRIRIFQSIINMICGAPSLVEALGLNPVDLIVIETDGQIEAVDSLKTTYRGATRLGFHLEADDFDKVAGHIGVRSRQMGAGSLSAECQSCSLVQVCGGGYLPHRYSQARGFDNPSVYCADLKKLISHIHRSVTGAVAVIADKAARRAADNGFASSAGMAACHRPIEQLARQALEGSVAPSVLDLGCGNGMLLRAISAQTGATPFGLEIDARKARYARKLLRPSGGRVDTANLFSAVWPDRVFDLVVTPITIFLEAPGDLASELRARLSRHARNVLVYAYDDDRRRFGSLEAIAQRIGLPLSGPILDETASLADLNEIGVQAKPAKTRRAPRQVGASI
jgi:uncharacterized protein